MSQSVSHRLLTSGSQVQSQYLPHDVSAPQSGIRIRFLLVIRVRPTDSDFIQSSSTDTA
jgi:hypothetical protein